MNKKYYIETYGCQMNVHDTEKMSGILSTLGYGISHDEYEADLILINTCSVREKAAQKVFTRLGELKILKKGRPDLVIGVCGCLAQQEGDVFLKGRPYVDMVFGPKNARELPQMLARLQAERTQLLELSGPRQEPTFEVETVLRDSSVKAYVTIMEGCDKFCTFCVVPFLRGREISRAPHAILEEARRIAEQGYMEVCLLGQNVNSYRHDGFDFADLLLSLHEIPGIRRIRYTSPHPCDINKKVMDLYGKLHKLCRHLHLPLQAGSNEVLCRMKRDYSRETYLSRVEYLKKHCPDIAFSTDIIVGFPGETEADFEQTMEIVRQVEYASIYSFKYSPRPYTAALNLEDDVPEEDKSDRLMRLQETQRGIQQRLNTAMIGAVQEVLVESHDRRAGNLYHGRTQCNRIVNFAADTDCIGRLAPVDIQRATANSLAGVLHQ
jgi:tRNA-2-methylthio-N6-dimethylallyladenosine synthase